MTELAIGFLAGVVVGAIALVALAALFFLAVSHFSRASD